MIMNPLIAKRLTKWLFVTYVWWSICADLLLITGIVAILLGYGKISF